MTVLIALLAILGVDLIVIVVLLAAALSRKRWVKRQPGSSRGAIRVSGGEIDGLVWMKAPFFFAPQAPPTGANSNADQ